MQSMCCTLCHEQVIRDVILTAQPNKRFVEAE